MGKYLTKYSTGGEPAELTTGGVRMKAKKRGTVEEITGGGGKKRRKLEDEDVHVSSSSSSCLKLHSRTLVIRQPAGEKKKRKTEYSVETANCGEGVERNRALSRCSSNFSGDFETTEERRSRSGDHNQESKEKGEDADFEFESCNLHHYHYDSEGGEEGRRREWKPSSDQEKNCSREEEAEEEEEELDNLEAKGRGVEILSGRSIRPKTSGRNTSMLKLSSKMPSETEIEEFFTAAENDQNKKFMEKYNYDLVNDAPVEGRYEWIKLNP